MRGVKTLKGLAILFAVLIFLASVAPFTPAVLLGFLNLVVSGLAFWFGAQRFAATLLYWSIAAILVSPMNGLFGFDSGYFFFPLLIGGIVAMLILYVTSNRTQIAQ